MIAISLNVKNKKINLPIELLDESIILISGKKFKSIKTKIYDFIQYFENKISKYKENITISISLFLLNTKPLDESEEYKDGMKIVGIEDRIKEYKIEIESDIDRTINKIEILSKFTEKKISKSKYELAEIDNVLKIYSNAEKKFIKVVEC